MSAKFDINNLGPWLKQELKNRKLKGSEVAKRAGISRQALSMYKKGERFPTYANLTAILAALGYDLTIVKTDKEAERELIEKFKGDLIAELLTYGVFGPEDRIIQIIKNYEREATK